VVLRTRLALEPRDAPLIGLSRCKACLSAVIEPNASVDTSEAATVNASTAGYTAISARRGKSLGPMRTRASTPSCASSQPSAPPAAPNTKLSTSNALAIRARPAPSAARTASSWRRASARTSMRFAMLAHAISSTAPIAPMSTHNVLATLPTRSSFNGRTVGRMRQLFVRSTGLSDQASNQIGSMRSRSARASAAVTPGASRASASKLKLPNGFCAGSSRTATITSGCGAISRNLNPLGITPTTRRCPVTDRDSVGPLKTSIESSRPSTASSPPNRRCQKAYEMMTGSGPSAAGAYSCSVNHRPSTG
jgi:hypothetical protein